MKKATIALVLAALALAACESDAQKVGRNVSTAADQFEVQRHIVGINGITDEVLFEVEGRCSIQRDGDLVVTCKHSEDDYRRHFIGLSDNVTFVSTQMEGIDADVYRTRIILKPENIVPNFDLVTGERE
jgi:predicted small secreted protein